MRKRDIAMDVLITGGTGFLGAHLCRRLVAEGHRVSVLHRATSNLARIYDLPLRQVTGDITDAAAVLAAAQGQEVVIHAAAHLAYWRQMRQAQAAINVDGTRHVVAACTASGVRRLIHISSVAAIGIPEDGRAADETFAFNLQQSGLNYPISKREAELAVLHAVDHGLDAVVVNPSSIFGPDGRSFRGAGLIEKVRRGRFVTYFPGGINAVHVDDVVDGILAALAQGRSGQRYILGGENLTYRRAAEIVLQELAAQGIQRRQRLVRVPAALTWLAAQVMEPAGALRGVRPRFTYDVHYCAQRFQYYDSGKAHRELGYRARPFAEIVRGYLGCAGALPAQPAEAEPSMKPVVTGSATSRAQRSSQP